MRQLLIFPYNGNALEALDSLPGDMQCVGFIDDDPSKHGTSAVGLPVFGRDALERYPEAALLAVPGSPKSFSERKAVIDSLGVAPDRFVSVVHPGAFVSAHARIGRNCWIGPGAAVMANAVIGDHVCLLANSVIHHDSVLGDHVLVGSNCTVAGHAVIGDNVYIGSGSTIRDHVRIGAGTLVGMGSNVLHDVAASAIIYGNPAKTKS